MCLLKVDKSYGGTSKVIRTRYKVFEYTTEGLLSFIVPSYDILPHSKWLDEKKYRLESYKDAGIVFVESIDHTLEYPIGWHVFTEIDNAKLFALLHYGDKNGIIYKVQCKGILAKGTDVLNRRVEVYRYIKIEKEV